jgi:3-hydroxyisobutyrate dehydrogenase-like beta-hydroxyacid dehydrogenase
LLTPASFIAVIGFGETGLRIATPLARRGVALRAHDLLLDASGTSQQMRARIEAAGVDPAGTLADALRGARLVIAAVGNGASRSLVQSAAPQLVSGQVYLDLSGAATDVHLGNATLIERSGAQYVAGDPGTPLLLAGIKAASLAEALETLGCPARAIANLPQCCTSEDQGAAGSTTVRWRGNSASSTPLRCELP